MVDSTNAWMLASEIPVKNVEINDLTSAAADAHGNYTVPFPRPGNYTITVEAAGNGRPRNIQLAIEALRQGSEGRFRDQVRDRFEKQFL